MRSHPTQRNDGRVSPSFHRDFVATLGLNRLRAVIACSSDN